MLPFLAPIVGMLAEKGLSLLSDTVSSVTDKGVDKLKEFVEEKVGIDITSKEQVQKLTPEQIEKLKRLEFEEKKFFEEIKFRYYQESLKDRADARSMQKEALKQDDKFSKRFIYYYAGFITIITFIYIYLITFLTIPKENIRFADTVLGFLLGQGLSVILAFFFGSSHSSQIKNKVIEEIKSKGGIK